jgi:hypothetical protein
MYLRIRSFNGSADVTFVFTSILQHFFINAGGPSTVLDPAA